MLLDVLPRASKIILRVCNLTINSIPGSTVTVYLQSETKKIIQITNIITNNYYQVEKMINEESEIRSIEYTVYSKHKE